MSHFCSNIRCPNRITIGKETDDDVVNIICPKCERLLYVSEKKTIKYRKKRNWFVIFIIVLVLIFTVFLNQDIVFGYINRFNENKTIILKESNQNLKQKSINYKKNVTVIKDTNIENIKSLLKAEDQRDFNLIKTYYPRIITRYWNSNYISIDELKRLYLNSWKKTSYSKNEVKEIKKINDNTYILQTHFTFFYIKKGVEKEIDSKVKFVFDKNGKIDKVYGVE